MVAKHTPKIAEHLIYTNVQLRLGRRPEYLGRDERTDTPDTFPFSLTFLANSSHTQPLN